MPLHTAAIRRDANIAMFLALKIDDLDDMWYSPLSDAALYENTHIASMLPDLGAYPEGAPANPAKNARKLSDAGLEKLFGSARLGDTEKLVVPEPLPQRGVQRQKPRAQRENAGKCAIG
jgi:hypothetical protein